jgi:ABC-2 type transport system ATP-binding protein
VALALTLAKRPRVLLLDEPLAALDPLARRDFPATLAEAAAMKGQVRCPLWRSGSPPVP